jgi:hypothetical protein
MQNIQANYTKTVSIFPPRGGNTKGYFEEQDLTYVVMFRK